MFRLLGYRALYAPLLAACFLAVIGLTSIVNAQQQYWILEYPVADFVPMNPNTGLALVLVSMALALRSMRFPSRVVKAGASMLASIFSVAVIAAGTLALLRELFNVQIGEDYVISAMQASMQGANIVPLAAAGFVLAGSCLLFIDYRTPSNHYPAEYSAVILGAVMSVPLIGHIYHVISFSDTITTRDVAPMTSIAFVVLALGILAARPGHRLMSLWNSQSPGGPLLRRLLPNSLLLLIVLDFLVKWGAQHGFYHADKTSPILILLASSLLFIMFCRTANLLNREHEVRQQGEEALAESNALLRAVSDNTPDAIFVKDRAGHMIFANPAKLRLLGKESDEVIGFRSQELYIDSEDANRVMHEDRLVLESGVAQVFETTTHFPSGMRTLHSTKAPWLNAKGEIMGLVGISVDITDRKRIEDALKAHETQLEALVASRTAEVNELIGHLETTREEEKKAIARELHDDLGSALTALNMHLSLISQQMPDEPKFTERMAKIKTLLTSITTATRRIQNGLRPDKLDVFGIKVAIAEQALEFEKYSGISCEASLPDDNLAYAPRVDIALFRMVQESLNNIAKHAQASHVDIILDDTDDEIILHIRDDGIGIAPDRLTDVMTHGLRGMRERATYLGGAVNIRNAPNGGTLISAIIPKIPANMRYENGVDLAGELEERQDGVL
ncbi:PAS domain-containing protein [uncultured Oxalicibacterium sp.]|uniref:PAS domain-containing sensor histidine kinase n=1 Tax=uncultured Oxalicibacterium sp. TaxID=1168540 RepID=UPI0025EA299A|nr:PAS domain-containing protein [uncultured Oxalicibacterium sp.]